MTLKKFFGTKLTMQTNKGKQGPVKTTKNRKKHMG